jgi:hypothetical protein
MTNSGRCLKKYLDQHASIEDSHVRDQRRSRSSRLITVGEVLSRLGPRAARRALIPSDTAKLTCGNSLRYNENLSQ